MSEQNECSIERMWQSVRKQSNVPNHPAMTDLCRDMFYKGFIAMFVQYKNFDEYCVKAAMKEYLVEEWDKEIKQFKSKRFQ